MTLRYRHTLRSPARFTSCAVSRNIFHDVIVTHEDTAIRHVPIVYYHENSRKEKRFDWPTHRSFHAIRFFAVCICCCYCNISRGYCPNVTVEAFNLGCANDILTSAIETSWRGGKRRAGNTGRAFIILFTSGKKGFSELFSYVITKVVLSLYT